jgi:hypothetical protein
MIESQLVLCEIDQKVGLDPVELSFYLDDDDKNSVDWPFSHNKSLEYLTGQIARQSRNLYLHIQRIHFCYRNNLGEQLYAALLDMFLCNRGDGGLKLRQRMLGGVKSKLANDQARLLKKSLELGGNSALSLPVNRYSIFGTGVTGARILVKQIIKADGEADPLILALDFIEYSQLDEARKVLETAILKQTDREDITVELFQLYKSTQDLANFQKTYKQICTIDTPLRSYWDDFNALMTAEE